MAEIASLEQPDLASGIPNSPTQKRKRGTESASPDTRRTKRAASASDQIAMEATAFLDAADGSHMSNAINHADFSALQEATVDHPAPDATDPGNASSTAAAALSTMYPTMHVPQTTEVQFAQQAVVNNDHHTESPYEAPPEMHNADGLPMVASTPDPQPGSTIRAEIAKFSATPYAKPAVGTEEWHKQRKDNHKEGASHQSVLSGNLKYWQNTVERRRRETINEGINELAKIVPGCEKNKGSILQRAVSFITQLKENETSNIEKWTLEKLLTEQAVSELSSQNEKLKQEVERLYREVESWKSVAQAAGLSLPSEKAASPAA